jgi:dipeptidyl aminopeptidase/acylaminoacyl peptidase
LDLEVTQRTVAPFGTWASRITAEMVAESGTLLTMPWLEREAVWWLEGRPAEDGRVVLVRAGHEREPRDVVPTGFDVRTAVHEYGGGAYCIHEGTAFVSNSADQRLWRVEPGGQPVAVTPAVEGRGHRYADGRVTRDGGIWVGVRERHAESGRVSDVVNELVAVPTDGSAEPRIITGGRDFYSNPRISPDGSRLCFLAWDLPWMPWDGCELFIADLATDGELTNLARVAGVDGTESIWQPEWSPTGDLVFASDRSGWWNLERVRGGERSVLHPAEAEFGYPRWVFGASSFAFLDDGRIVCAYDSDGFTTFGILDPETGALDELELGLDSWRRSPYVRAEGSRAAVIAGSPTVPDQLVVIDTSSGEKEIVRTSAELPVGAEHVSVPRAIEFPTDRGLVAHALVYRPLNPAYDEPVDETPPLLVMSHGGPTGNTTAILDLELQFWTSRGFAVVDVDYGGSTGYGRAYRERLNGQWGVVDLRDCVNAARHLVEQGEADGDRLLIRGGSAGGYTTMCGLTFTEDFAAGTTYYGLADLEQFVGGETHKFESRYEETLVGPYPERAELYRARSPIHFVDRISTPMLVLQGADDVVVPPSQAERIVTALRERGVPHAYVLFEGEGHVFRRAESTIVALEAELSFYAQVLGFEPGDRIPRLEIANAQELTLG